MSDEIPSPQTLVSMDQLTPDKLFIMPLFGRPMFPGIMAPIMITSQGLVDGFSEHSPQSDFIGLVLVKNSDAEKIGKDDIHRIGTVARVIKKVNLPDGGVNILVNTIKRFVIKEFTSETAYRLTAMVEYPEDIYDEDDIETKAMIRNVLSSLKRLASQDQILQEQVKLTLANIDEPGKIADFVTSILNLEKQDYQLVLETMEVKERLRLVMGFLNKEVQLIELQQKIHKQMNEKMEKQQREFMLREQLKAIKKELGIEEDVKSQEVREFTEKLKKMKIDDDIKARIEKEVEKYSFIEPHSAEYTVMRNYLDTVFTLPWDKTTKDNINIARAERFLNRDHHALEDVKNRILEFLAVRKLKPDSRGSIICLVGPPGVGKTSLGKSIANAMSRKFYRFSLGGMRDEAEIKGHRRTYVGAMPGKIINALKAVGTANPVLMLDEIDKIGASFQGDPASALLEVLDPEQNSNFVDHYLDLPFDLSSVLFITTANTLETIPRPLLDRMEVISISGYINEEKVEIGRKYLLPRQLERHGLEKDDVKISKPVLRFIINNYAREAGVRNLERNLEKICRKVAALKARKEKLPDTITTEIARNYLGPETYSDDLLAKNLTPGTAIGMAFNAFGGSTLMIESVFIPGREGFKLTGQLGDVMKESADIAFSYVRSVAGDYKIDAEIFSKNTLHLHVPAGATPKDGPSAGITMATSIISLAMNKSIKPNVSMTGELTLNGHVLPIGGLKEKIIAARRNGMKEIIFPFENKRDLEEIPEHVKKELQFYPVKHAKEVFDIMFNGK